MKGFWDKHKRKISEIVVWGIAVIVFIFAIPIAINWFYKQPASLPILAMNWEGKDALSFYGSLLGAAATIFVLTETINFTRENQKEERKLSIKPYLETQKHNYTNFDDFPDDKNIIYMEINPHMKICQGAPPEEIRDIIEVEKQKISDHDYIMKSKEFFDQKYLLYYEISNCGAGNAINVVMKINKETFIPGFCITTNSPKKIMFIFDNDLLSETENKDYKFELTFEYTDISSLGTYSQMEEIIFSKRNNRIIIDQKESGFLSKPKEKIRNLKNNKL